MLDCNLKALVMAVCFSLMSANALATLEADKTVLNKTDRATVVARFKTPVTGDLYVATLINGQLNFIADQGKTLTTEVKAFQLNATYHGVVKILDVTALNIAPGHYPLYQVVTFAGKDPLNFLNWVGGLGSLHRLNFNIGLPTSATHDFDGDGFSDDDSDHDGYSDDDHDYDGNSDTCKTPANSRKKGHEDKDDDDDDDVKHNSATGTSATNCTSVPTTGTTTQPTRGSGTNASGSGTTSDTSKGKALYVSLTCSGGGCHTANPALNRNHVLNGRTLAGLKSAIAKNPEDMGFLRSTSDADLQAVADFLKAF